MLLNLLVAMYIFTTEIKRNSTFNEWFRNCPVLSSIITLLATSDLQIIVLLRSKLFGWKLFDAPLSEKADNIIRWYTFANIFVEDLPQLFFQIYYFNSVVSYDLFPLIS